MDFQEVQSCVIWDTGFIPLGVGGLGICRVTSCYNHFFSKPTIFWGHPKFFETTQAQASSIWSNMASFCLISQSNGNLFLQFNFRWKKNCVMRWLRVAEQLVPSKIQRREVIADTWATSSEFYLIPPPIMFSTFSDDQILLNA